MKSNNKTIKDIMLTNEIKISDMESIIDIKNKLMDISIDNKH